MNGRESLRQSGLVLRDGRQCQPMIEAQRAAIEARFIINIGGQIEARALRAKLGLGQGVAQPAPEPEAGPAMLCFTCRPRNGLQRPGEWVDRCL